MNHSDRLETLKTEYQAIPVPADAREKLIRQMNRARADKKRMRRRLWQRGALMTAAAAMLCLVIGCNSNASIAYAMSEIPILGDIARVVTFRTYENRIGNMEAEVKVPYVEDENPTLSAAVEELNQTVESYTSQIIKRFEADVAEATGTETGMDVITDYEVITNNDRWFSLRINTGTCMAGTMSEVMIYHIDKQTGKMVTLKDLFREDSDFSTRFAKVLVEEMERRMEENPKLNYFVGDNVYSREDDLTSISDNQNFYISAAGKLVVVFDKYAVAPGSMGVVEIEVPTEKIKDMVKDGYLR